MRPWTLTLLALALLAGAAPLPAGEDAPSSKPATKDAEEKLPPRERMRRLAEMNVRVRALFAEKDYAEAKAVLEKMLALAPRHAPSWYNLACAHSRLGATAESLACLEKALEHGYTDVRHMNADPDLEAVRKARGYKAVRKAMAKAGKETAGESKAAKTAALLRRFVKLIKKEEYEACLEVLDRSLRIDPENAVTHYNRACVLSLMDRPEEALDELETSVEQGFASFRHIERDADLDNLRQADRYRGLLARREEIQRARAERIHQQLVERFGDGYLYEIDHENRLVFATDVDRRTLNELKAVLTAYAEAQWRDLFAHGFDQYVTVVIPRGEVRRGIGGYYSGATHTLVARTVGSVLQHEFTHALHGADQEGRGQKHPIWITEGLATLFELAPVEDGRAVPGHNRRLNIIKALVERGRHIPLAELVELPHQQAMRRARIFYPQVRYLMMHLYEAGLLNAWYDAYAGSYEEDASGVRALEQVLGKPLEEIETDWIAWLGGLDALPRGIPVDHAYVGVQVAPDVEGLKIVRVVPTSGADRAGLRPGDIIYQVNDVRTVDPEELVGLVGEHAIGDRVIVHYRRDGAYAEAAVELLARPATPPAERRKDEAAEEEKAPEHRQAAPETRKKAA